MKNPSIKHLKVLIVGIAALLSQVASAAIITLPTSGIWEEFLLDTTPGGTWLSILDGQPVTFEVNSPTPWTLRIVDGGSPGDRVSVSINNAVVGTSSAVPNADPMAFAFTADDAFADLLNFSQFTANLVAGIFQITGTTLALGDPNSSSNFYISAVSSPTSPPPPAGTVPEPATPALVLAGMLMGATAARRRRGN